MEEKKALVIELGLGLRLELELGLRLELRLGKQKCTQSRPHAVRRQHSLNGTPCKAPADTG